MKTVNVHMGKNTEICFRSVLNNNYRISEAGQTKGEEIMSFMNCIISLAIAGIVFRVICKITKSGSNKLLIALLIVAVAVNIYIGVDTGDDSEVSMIILVIATRLAYNIFSIKADPETLEAVKPKLYMQDGKVALYLPNAERCSRPLLKTQSTYNLHEDEYVFDDVSITRNYGIVTIAGSGTKITLEHNDAEKPGVPVSREHFQDRIFKYNIDEMKIDDTAIEGMIA